MKTTKMACSCIIAFMLVLIYIQLLQRININTFCISLETNSKSLIEGAGFLKQAIIVSDMDEDTSTIEDDLLIQDDIEVNSEEQKETDDSNIIEPSAKRIAYLTFDDGPSDNNTPRILDILKEYNIKATFFVNGNGSEDLYKRIINEGHVIGNHTYSHDYGDIYSSVDSFEEDVSKLNDFLEEITGKRPGILRFPGGSNNTVSHQYGGAKIMKTLCKVVTDDMGYQYFDWNVSSEDATTYRASKNFILSSTLNQSRYVDRAIVLMHDATAKTTTADALTEIIDGLMQMGFEFDVLTKDVTPVQFESP